MEISGNPRTPAACSRLWHVKKPLGFSFKLILVLKKSDSFFWK